MRLRQNNQIKLRSTLQKELKNRPIVKITKEK